MSIVDLIFPKLCVGCGREGQYICLDCQKHVSRPEAICPMCTRPSLDGWVHPRCKTSYGMERLVVGLLYRGVVQQCLKKVKYRSAWEIIQFLYTLAKLEKFEGVITSVPMWREKVRARGFNQAHIIAGFMGKRVELLTRTRETRPMFGLGKIERQKNIEGAFTILNHLNITPLHQRVILVDDVWTTGSTMRACAKVLKQAGVKEVWGVTLAR